MKLLKGEGMVCKECGDTRVIEIPCLTCTGEVHLTQVPRWRPGSGMTQAGMIEMHLIEHEFDDYNSDNPITWAKAVELAPNVPIAIVSAARTFVNNRNSDPFAGIAE